VEEVAEGFPFTGDATIDGTLNIDFTDALDFITSDDLSVDAGDIFIFGPGWVNVFATGDAIASKYEDADSLLYNGTFDLEFDSGMGLLPVTITGEVFKIKTGSYAGSVMNNDIIKDPSNSYSNEITTNVTDGADNRSYIIGTRIIPDTNSDGIIIQKTNESGEVVQINTSNNSTGFILGNTLADNSASLFDIQDNTFASVFEVRNDGIFVGPNIPTADPLVLGQIWSDNGVLTISAGTP
jgi:hypothetical protein